MKNIFAGFTSKMRAPTTAEREMAYLVDSRDRYDLEFRQRQIDRGMFRAHGNASWI